MRLRIVVVDDSAIFLKMFVSVLETEFDVVAAIMNGMSALEIIRGCQPDVVVLDLEMPGLNGIELTRELVKCNPRPAIVICSTENDSEIIEAARESDALGYVFKARVTKDLNVAIRSAARGDSFVSTA